MKKDNEIYLRHILDAIILIKSYIHGATFESFQNNMILQDAVIRRLQIIGEAVRQLSEDFRNHYPNIPYGEILGMRNRITHDYLGVVLEIVWEVVQQDLPKLELEIQTILNKE